GMRGRMGIEDESLLPYTGLIAQKPHSTNAIENVLGDYFSVPAKALQFFGQWLDLDPADYTKLGVDNSVLGSSAIIGTRVWDQPNTSVIEMGSRSYGYNSWWWRQNWFEHQNFRDERAEAFCSLLWE